MSGETSELYKVGQFVRGEFDESATNLENVKNALTAQINAIAPSTPTDSFVENTFTEGLLTSQIRYTSDGGLLISTKEFTYVNGNLTQVTTKDTDDEITLLQTIAYDVDGNVSSITKDYA